MSYYIVFKDRNRQPIKVTDEQGLKVAEAKDAGRQIQTKTGFIDPVIIAEIVDAERFESRGEVNFSKNSTEPEEKDVPVKREVLDKFSEMRGHVQGKAVKHLYSMDGEEETTFKELLTKAREMGYRGGKGTWELRQFMGARDISLSEIVVTGDSRKVYPLS